MSRGRFDRGGRGTTVWLPGMGSRLHGNDEWEPGMGSRLHGNDEWLPGMGSRLHGNDEWEPGMGSRLHGNDGLVAADGFPFARERRFGCRGWVPVCTGTTVGEPGMGFRCHGNDGGGVWFLYAAPTGGRTRGSAPTAGHARIPLIASLTRTAPGRAGFKPAPTGAVTGEPLREP